MRRRLFGGDDEEPVRADDPPFRVLRFELPDRPLAADPLVLRIESEGATHRVVAVEVEDALDFLVPAELLGGGARLIIEAGGEELPAPEPAESPVSVREAYLAVQEELEAAARRVERLRQDLRAERSRGAGDEPVEVPPARENPAISQLRAELERERAAREELDRELDALDERRAALASELAEVQAALREERAGGVAPPREIAVAPVHEDETEPDTETVEAARNLKNESPARTSEALERMDVDKLAEVYDVAIGVWQARDEVARPQEVERWQNLAQAVLEEARGRPELRDADPAGSRLRGGRRQRLRAQLIEAAQRDG